MIKMKKILNASEQGLATLKESVSMRYKWRDVKKQSYH